MEYNDDSFNMIGSDSGPDITNIVEDPKELTAFVRTSTDRDDIKFGKFKWISQYRPNIHMVNKFSERQVFVARGLPFIVLLWLDFTDLQTVCNPAGDAHVHREGLASTSLLSIYNNERLPIITKMLNISTDLFEQFADTADENAWDRSSQLLQLGVHCCWSPIVIDKWARAGDDLESTTLYAVTSNAVRTADRAPDVPGLRGIKGINAFGVTTLLLCVFGPSYHTMLIFTP
ncbi:hypothetical protein OBBRIDRAFT_739548 [Obba rivulosa]|uniref:Uncharacterized protein n=1 Tax=Obba rivulosa TaxID=1052685 RepID=A0A8E2ANV6_9APHY|nr:hypothetical protein OBBRIDRAFT_739548 [Obba rivulosa]